MPWIVGGLLMLAAAFFRQHEDAILDQKHNWSGAAAWTALAIMANATIG